MWVIALALGNMLTRRERRTEPPNRILVAHHLLLGDTLMLTPLLAKLRMRYPEADVFMLTPKAVTPLYRRRPYGVTALPYDPRDFSTFRALREQTGFDLAIVPGDNRYSWLAKALDARHIVAFAGDRPAYKNWPVDELLPYPDVPAAWADMVAGLIPGPAPAAYSPDAWPDPEHAKFEPPTNPYCVLHVGASTPLKQWEKEKWLRLVDYLETHGYQIVWSGGNGEEKLVAALDPAGRHLSYAGKLDLAQLWHLLKNAKLLVCPDTGIAHLGRLTGTPTVTLFGPGSAAIAGAGNFWRNNPYTAVTVETFPCRDQHVLFKRVIPWVRRCGRSTRECSVPRCMQAVSLESVTDAARRLLDENARKR